MTEGETAILLVDDEDILREPLAAYLVRQGFAVTEAASAAAARSVLVDITPDLVLLDIMMPGEDGLSLCRHLLEVKNIPTILLTARGEATDRIIGLEIGADDYLVKPFQPRELVARIRSVLRRTNRLPGASEPAAEGADRDYLFEGWRLDVLKHRLTDRPLADLTRRVEGFGRAPAGQPPYDLPDKLRGPEDVQRLVTAQQAMERRIAAMLNEKDVMLGAIGHDLKTPLAALRIRIETVEDDAERRKMAASIDDLSQTLDDILALARIGRSHQPPERAELSTLVTAVVEEFEDMGAQVELGPMVRIVRPVQVTLLRRALRNLVSNALRYGEVARVSVKEEGGAALLRVEDEGGGIAEDQIGAMMEPFVRGEASRNRATGGSGLGLAIARAIAESLGGKLVLANGPEGGLRAEIRIP